MTIKSTTAPALSFEGLEKLRSACRPTRMTSQTTLFDAGVEQQKRDFLAMLDAEVARPSTQDPRGLERGQVIPVTERQMRAAVGAKTRPSWWERTFG